MKNIIKINYKKYISGKFVNTISLDYLLDVKNYFHSLMVSDKNTKTAAMNPWEMTTILIEGIVTTLNYHNKSVKWTGSRQNFIFKSQTTETGQPCA